MSSSCQCEVAKTAGAKRKGFLTEESDEMRRTRGQEGVSNSHWSFRDEGEEGEDYT